jgi:hypothetical protein
MQMAGNNRLPVQCFEGQEISRTSLGWRYNTSVELVFNGREIVGKSMFRLLGELKKRKPGVASFKWLILLCFI